MSAYLMVSLHTKTSIPFNNNAHLNPDDIISKFATHEWWDTGMG